MPTMVIQVGMAFSQPGEVSKGGFQAKLDAGGIFRERRRGRGPNYYKKLEENYITNSEENFFKLDLNIRHNYTFLNANFLIMIV